MVSGRQTPANRSDTSDEISKQKPLSWLDTQMASCQEIERVYDYYNKPLPVEESTRLALIATIQAKIKSGAFDIGKQEAP